MKLSFFPLSKKRFPFLSLLLAAMVGILVEDYFSFPSYWLLVAIVVIGTIILSPLCSSWRGKLLFIFVAGCFAIFHAWQWQESPAAQLATLIGNAEENISVEGRVISEPKTSKNGSASFFLALEKISFEGQSAFLPVTMRVHWEGPSIAYGDEVTFQAEAKRPKAPRNPGEFDAVAWLTRKGVWTELVIDPSDPGKILSTNHGWFFLRWAFTMRHWAERTLELGLEQAPEIVTLIQGIILGASHHQTVEFLNDFQLTGTMHLFAISGLHVGMIAVVVWFVLKFFRLPQYLAMGLTIGTLFFYVMVTGFHTGSWRAAIMASLVLCSFLVERRPQMLNSLAAAGFCLLAVETNLLFSPGWQFSFGVVASIILLAHPLQKLLQPYCQSDPFIPKQLLSSWQVYWHYFLCHSAELISLSLASWIGALIPSFLYFHHLSFSALGANVLAVPLAFCIFSIAVVSLLSGLFSSWMAVVFNNANFIFAKLLLLTVHAAKLLPWSSVAVGPCFSSSPSITLFDIPGSQVVFLEDHTTRWLINTGRAASTTKTILPFLETKGVTQLDGLFLTGEEPNFLGGGTFLLRSLLIKSLFIAQEKNCSRPCHQLLQCAEQEKKVIVKLQDDDRFSLSPMICVGIFSPPKLEQKNKKVDFKITIGKESFLFLPSLSEETKKWLLQHKTSKELHATVLVLPWNPMPPSPEDDFLKAVAPRYVVIERDLRHQITLDQAWKDLFKQNGMELLYQEETGALLFKVVPEGLEILPCLTRIFHASQSAAWPKSMATVSGSNSDQNSMYSYSPDQNSSPSLSYQLFPSPRCERYEISGLKSK